MTGPAVVVVTDSSACLPVEMRDRWGIRVVPLHILLDGADLRDGIDDVPEDIYARDGVSTAGTNPEELTDAYRAALADSGGAGVVAVHISAALSGTFGAAEHVAAQFSGVRVIDSRSAAMGTGFAALAAARAAAGGADIDAVVAAADAAVQRSRAYLVVHRLDNLRRSGRIGSAAAWLGTALSLKPLLAVDDGKLVLAQRIRTVGKAVTSMIDRVCEVVEIGRPHWPYITSPIPTGPGRSPVHWPSGYRPARRPSSAGWDRHWRYTSEPARWRCVSTSIPRRAPAGSDQVLTAWRTCRCRRSPRKADGAPRSRGCSCWGPTAGPPAATRTTCPAASRSTA